MAPSQLEEYVNLWPQWATALTVVLLSISFGMAVGWTSPYVAQLSSESSPLHVTRTQTAWVVSLLPLGRFFGAIVGAVVLEYFGSKRSLLCSGFPIAISWACLICANSAGWLYMFRFCAGFAIGMYFSSFSIYIGEIAIPKIRGALVSLIINGLGIGMLLGNTMGTLVSMKSFGIVSLTLNICYILIFSYLPESPHYHVRQNNPIKAKETIKWYHRESNVEKELELIEQFVRSSRAMNFREKIKRIMEKKNRRMLAVIMILSTFVQLSGANPILYYMEIILIKAGVTCLYPGTVVMMTSGLAIVMGALTVVLIDRCGRRKLMTVSCSCVMSAMMLLGLQFTLLEQNYDPKTLQWIPILAMMLFIMMAMGMIPVPSTMLSEVFPDDLKSIASFMTSITSALFAFISSRTFQPMVNLMTEKFVFFTYGLILIGCIAFSVLHIPETQGKSLQEIQDMLRVESISEENIREQTI